MTTNNTTNAANKEEFTINLKMIRKAEKFLGENYLYGVFNIFCGEIRTRGAQEKWDHNARWEAIARWVSEQELFHPLEDGIPTALTEWYEKLYLPSKRVPYNRNNGNSNNSGYNKNNKGKGQQNGESNGSNYNRQSSYGYNGPEPDDFARMTDEAPFV